MKTLFALSLAASLVSVAGCVEPSNDNQTLTQDDTAIDIDTNVVTVSGNLLVNGAPIDSTTKMSIRVLSATDYSGTTFVNPPAGTSTYSFRAQKGAFRISVLVSSQTKLVGIGEYPLPIQTFQADTAVDIDIPLAKFTSHLTINGEPISNVEQLNFRETTTGAYYRFDKEQLVNNLLPFVGYMPPGSYDIGLETRGEGPNFESTSYKIATALQIQ